MVVGVGVDIVKIKKLRAAVDRWGRDFLHRVFAEEELSIISPGKIYYQRLAGRFAAKEAVIKAISKEGVLNLKDIVILNRNNGAPFCVFKKKNNLNIFLSISHIEDYAVACAVAEKKS